MNVFQELAEAAVGTGRTLRGEVVELSADGVSVELSRTFDRVVCDVLQTAEAEPLRLVEGDTVLVWWEGNGAGRGVILGRVAQARLAGGERAGECPDELVLEARRNLVLRCGGGTITLRQDGKILVKGEELVSHAKRTNRIRGGSVAIN